MINRLPALATNINTEHQAAIRDARSAMEHAIRCGELLSEARAAVPHGQWGAWVESNLAFGDRQARKYMRVARHAEAIRNSSSDFTIEGALAELGPHRAVATTSPSDGRNLPRFFSDYLTLRLKQIDERIELSPAGLSLPEDLTFEQWLAVGAALPVFYKAGAA